MDLTSCPTQVSTAAKAAEIVAEARFPPAGRRGFGSPFVHGTWGVSATDYLKNANNSVLVMIQIETKEGVENLEEIAKVPGLGAINLPIQILCPDL